MDRQTNKWSKEDLDQTAEIFLPGLYGDNESKSCHDITKVGTSGPANALNSAAAGQFTLSTSL